MHNLNWPTFFSLTCANGYKDRINTRLRGSKGATKDGVICYCGQIEYTALKVGQEEITNTAWFNKLKHVRQ